MAYPIMAPSNTWYKASVLRSTITEINIVDSYTPTGNETETWNADVDNSGSIKCYLNGTVLTIAGNGSGKIALNEDSSNLFSYAISSASEGNKLFITCKSINGLSLFDTSNVTTMLGVFAYCKSLTELDLTGWDVSNVKSFRYAFGIHSSIGTMSLTTIKGIEDWNVGKVTEFHYAFQYCSKLTNLNIGSWDTSSCTNMSYMFRGCSALTTIPVSNWDISKVADMSYLFTECSSLTTIPVSNWDTSSCTDMSRTFAHCYALTSLDISRWNVSKVTNFKSMFSMDSYGTTNTPITTLDVSNWDVSSATDMGWMFYGLANLTALDVSKWNVSKVENFHHCFAWCKNLVISGVENWNVCSAKLLNAMFHGNKTTSYDLSNWNVSNVESFAQMFEGNRQLTDIKGLENWNTSNGKAFYEMFHGCIKLKELNLSSFDTRNANESWIDPQRGAAGGGMYDMFAKPMDFDNGEGVGTYVLRSLEKITIGENFSFNGDGTCTPAILPAQSPTFIEDADGYWYDNHGGKFRPEEIPNLTAGTYYSVEGMTERPYLVKSNTMYGLRKAICSKTGTDEKLTPEQMTAVVNGLETTDEFWGIFQEYGRRKNYGYVFSGFAWTLDIFKPKYDICPTGALPQCFSNAFCVNCDISTHLSELGIKFDTSGVTNFSNMISYSAPSRLPVYNCTSATNVNRMFYYCTVVIIDKIIFSEEGNLDTNNMFEGSPSIESIEFEGTIGQSIRLHWSKNLTVDTMKSVITHLKDHSGTDKAGVYSVKFDTTCWDRLEADSTAPDGGTWQQYVTSLGWLI